MSFTEVASFQLWFKPIESAIHIDSLLNTVPKSVSTGVFVMPIKSLNVAKFSKSSNRIFIISYHLWLTLLCEFSVSSLLLILFSYTIRHFNLIYFLTINYII